jgi:hypothetical protein
MYERFGKSFHDIMNLKKSFFQDNNAFMKKTRRYAHLYTNQPQRNNCKICAGRLTSKPDFIKHNVPYAFCHTCGHLNGLHEDSDEFCAQVYTQDGGEEYARNYTAEDVEAFVTRRDAIYRPKAEFLLEALRREGEDVNALRFADMGAGAGYFVSAMHELGFPNTKGFEVGAAQVKLGNHVLENKPLSLIELGDTAELCKSHEAEVMSFIGVFEHVQDPRAILNAMRVNPRVRYFYFCVPMFSTCIYGEMAFPDVMPRQLAIGHTHLFTRQSIAHFANEFCLTPVAAWWFGTDMMDYYRSICVTLEANPATRAMTDAWKEEFEPVLDAMQLALDEKRRSSQVHMLMRFND